MTERQSAFERLCRAVSGDDEDPTFTALVCGLMENVAAGLTTEHALIFEDIADSLARAADRLGADATPFEIRDQARLFRRQRH
jgi:hypothetical protein